jgi:hypothetical protein
MLDDIINLVKEHAGEAINNNPAIPNEHNDAVAAQAGSSILDGLKDMISQGKAQDVLNLFSHPGDVQSNPAVQNISNGFVQNLVSKFGIEPAAAGGVAANLIPNVLQHLVQKTNDTSNSAFSLEGILGHLTGGQGVQGILGSLTSGGGEGVLDKLKGFFNK